MCKDVRVWEIKSFVMYFLCIVGILGFCDFFIFPSIRNTLILQSCTLCFPSICNTLILQLLSYHDVMDNRLDEI